jgi:hypothetical protein
MVTIHKHDWQLDIGAKEPIAHCYCGAWCEVDIENNVWGKVHMPKRAAVNTVLTVEKEMAVSDNVSTKKRRKELDSRWPEFKEAIERLGNFNQAAKECGVAYASLLTCATRHKFDASPYRLFSTALKNHGANISAPVLQEPKTNPAKPDSAQNISRHRGIELLIEMLPSDRHFRDSDEKSRWKAAFDSMFELIYGG